MPKIIKTERPACCIINFVISQLSDKYSKAPTLLNRKNAAILRVVLKPIPKKVKASSFVSAAVIRESFFGVDDVDCFLISRKIN